MRTLLETTTHIQKTKHTDASTTDAVCALIGWTVDRYCEFQFEKYIEFIDRMFDGCPTELLNQVKYHPDFSGFWNVEAAYRNEVMFLPFAKDNEGDLSMLLDEFLWQHNPLMLMHDDLFMLKYNNTLNAIRRTKNA